MNMAMSLNLNILSKLPKYIKGLRLISVSLIVSYALFNCLIVSYALFNCLIVSYALFNCLIVSYALLN